MDFGLMHVHKCTEKTCTLQKKQNPQFKAANAQCKYSNTSKKQPKQPITFKVPIFLWSIMAVLTPRYWKKYPKHHSPASRTRGIMALLEDSGFQFRMGNKTLTVCFMFFFREGCDKQKERIANPLRGFLHTSPVILRIRKGSEQLLI